MDIKILGAAGGEVTGSAYCVRTRDASVLIDAGMFQGGRQSEAKNRLPPAARPDQLDAVLLTHAHLDHSGRIPLLIKHGFQGPVFATEASIDLAGIILRDAARLQVQDVERTNRKRRERGQSPIEPLYEPEHVDPFPQMAQAVPFHKPIPVAKGMTARWIEAGHMFGSGCIELTVEEAGKRKVIVFSGDLGPTTMPILRPYEHFEKADMVFLESTYGDRDHRPYDETVAEFERIVKQVVAAKGKILVPTFAIGRSQQILYHLAVMFLQKKVPHFPVYLDSPMAIEATKVYNKHPDLFDDEFKAWQKKGLSAVTRDTCRPTATAAESMKLNDVKGPCIILAGAGMCNAGRILHHLKHNLDKPTTHVMIVGYQGDGSLGRQLVDRRTQVTIHQRRIQVRAQIHTLNGFSGHAGKSELLQWFSSLAPAKPQVVLTHGEDGPRAALGRAILQKHRITCRLPRLGEVIELS
ncbi:MAG: MBL fold metallo-hydrolase [Pirellulales bacterium]